MSRERRENEGALPLGPSSEESARPSESEFLEKRAQDEVSTETQPETATGAQKRTGVRVRWDLARRNIADDKERWTFIGILVVVSSVIFVGKAYFEMPALLGLLFAFFGITGYACIAWLDRNNRIRMDKAGDNCYYLGLTFTLASLSAVLVRIDFDVAVASAIVAGFGIALGSTILGIIARLILIQFVEELDDIEHRARVRLTDSADQLRIDLDNAAKRFQTFLFSIQDDVRASIVELTDDQLEKQKTLVEDVQQLLEQVVRNVDDASTSLTKTLKRHSTVMEKFNASAERTADAADKLAERVENIRLPHDDIESAVNRIIGEVDRIGEALNVAGEPFRNAASEFKEISNASRELSMHSAEMVTRAQSAAASLVDLQTQTTSSAAEGNAAVESLRNSIAELESGMSEFRVVAGKYMAGMTEVAEHLTDKINER